MKKIDFASFKAGAKKHRIIILILGLLLLSLSQQQLIMPLVYDIIKSDLFLVESKDQGSDLPISTPMTNIAFTHCNNYLKSQQPDDATLNFSDKPLKAWSLGNYQYIINGEVKVNSATSGTVTKKYACRITYDNGDNQEDALNIENWSIEGISDL